MSGSEDLTELAKRVQEAYNVGGEEGQRYVQTLLAERVEVSHTPPAPFDGVVDRKFLVSYQDEGWAKYRESLPDLHLEGKVTVEDGHLVVTKSFKAVKPDGSEVHAMSRVAFLVKDGEIVGVDSTGSVVDAALRVAAET